MNLNKELPCELIRCKSCIHNEVCAHIEIMSKYANIVKTALEGIFTSSDPITVFDSDFPAMFVLPMINCKFYETKFNSITSVSGTYDKAIELPYPYPDGGAGSILLKKDGMKEYTGKGCLVETVVHDHSNTSGKAIANSCEESYLEN